MEIFLGQKSKMKRTNKMRTTKMMRRTKTKMRIMKIHHMSNSSKSVTSMMMG